MTLDAKVQVDMPDRDVVVRKVGNSFPVYLKVVTNTRNQKGTPARRLVTIGRRDPSTGRLIPNSSYWSFFGPAPSPRTTPARESAYGVGEGLLVGGAMSGLGLVEILEEVLGEERSRLLRTAALFMACRGNVLDGLDDFCQSDPFPEAPLTSQTASQLFASITLDERTEFFKKWMDCRPVMSYLAYETTSFSTCAKEALDSELGNDELGLMEPKGHFGKLPRMSLACCVAEDSGLPCFYVACPDTNASKSLIPSLAAFCDELGMSKSECLVLGEDFCTEAGASGLAETGGDFVMEVDMRHEMAKMALSFARKSIENIKNRLAPDLFAMTVQGRFHSLRTTMHVFFDRNLANSQIASLFARIEYEESLLGKLGAMTEEEANLLGSHFSIELKEDGSFSFERNEGEIELACQSLGFFCLLTNARISGAEALRRLYRKRDIEKSFEDVKSVEFAKSPERLKISPKKSRFMEKSRKKSPSAKSSPDRGADDGKLFCAFIALIATSEIDERLGDFMRRGNCDRADLLRQMAKITVKKSERGWKLLNPLTKAQRAIMDGMGISEGDLSRYINA